MSDMDYEFEMRRRYQTPKEEYSDLEGTNATLCKCITQLESDLTTLNVALKTTSKGNARLVAENAALKLDAERYRWDRDNFMRENPNEYESTKDFDAAIDAAMAKGEA